MAYSDAELQDIGVRRRDIPAIAQGETPLAFEAANPAAECGRSAPAANDSQRLAA